MYIHIYTLHLFVLCVSRHCQELCVFERDVKSVARRAAEVSLPSVFSVAVGRRALGVETQAADLLSASEVGRAQVEAGACESNHGWVGLYKIFVYFEAVVQGSIMSSLRPQTSFPRAISAGPR